MNRGILPLVPQSATECYSGDMATENAVNQRDLRMRSKEIMDAVEGGQKFTVTRDGRDIAELVPLQGRRRRVPSEELIAMATRWPRVDSDAFMVDVRSAFGDELADPYER